MPVIVKMEARHRDSVNLFQSSTGQIKTVCFVSGWALPAPRPRAERGLRRMSRRIFSLLLKRIDVWLIRP